MSDTFCRQCRYASICVPLGHEKFFKEASKVMGFYNGMSMNENTMNTAVRRLAGFYLSVPLECPYHPAKEYARDVIAAMQGVPV